MKEYVLTSQGIVVDRSSNILPLMQYAITNNNEFFEYAQKCLDLNEPVADNYMELFEEEGNSINKLDLTLLEEVYNAGYEKGFNEGRK